MAAAEAISESMGRARGILETATERGPRETGLARGSSSRSSANCSRVDDPVCTLLQADRCAQEHEFSGGSSPGDDPGRSLSDAPLSLHWAGGSAHPDRSTEAHASGLAIPDGPIQHSADAA